MRPLLVIFNPRNMPLAVDSFNALPTDRAWLRGYTELEIETEAWPVMMRDAKGHRYSHLVVISDDGRVPRGAWDDVTRIAKRGHPVVTGFCNMDMNRGWDISNMVSSVLPREPLAMDMDFYSVPEILTFPEDEVPTSFHGYSLTCMDWKTAVEFPFQCYRDPDGNGPGHSSDFHHARRLADKGVDIVCARDGFVIHLKSRWNTHDETPEAQPVWLRSRRQRKTIVWDRRNQ